MFGRPSLDQQRSRRTAEREANLRALATPSRTLHRAAIARCDGAAKPVEKEPKTRPGKRTPTVAERAWMDWIVAYGCIACRIDGLAYTRPAVHHILSGGRRIGHLSTLPLCDPGHHQAGQQFGMTSRHPWKARFEQQYGSEESLLARLRAEYAGARA